MDYQTVKKGYLTVLIGSCSRSFIFMGEKILTRQYLKNNRRNLRNNSTSAEAVLWTYLKSRQLVGRKFRRQQSIENYIVDFYCPAENLVVELDGEGHYNTGGQISDEFRDERLKSLGFRVLRFENVLVFEHIETVLDEIKQCFQEGE